MFHYLLGFRPSARHDVDAFLGNGRLLHATTLEVVVGVAVVSLVYLGNLYRVRIGPVEDKLPCGFFLLHIASGVGLSICAMALISGRMSMVVTKFLSPFSFTDLSQINDEWF